MRSICRFAAASLLLWSAIVAPAGAQNSPREVLSSVVGLRSTIPDDARTSITLGTERSGSGVVIDEDGLILTIGYLILEASAVSIFTRDGKEVQAAILAYDHATGFGLLRSNEPLDTSVMAFGNSADLKVGDAVLAIGSGGPEGIRPATVVDRREFSGYWEYLLENAIFTAPAHAYFSGSALLDKHSRLVGIGSLIVSDAVTGAESRPGNMFVPIDLLKPILDSLVTTGRGPGPRRPWIGVFTEEHRGRVFVNRVAEESPASRAGLMEDDIILQVARTGVSSMAEFYRAVWGLGAAGATIPLTVLRGSKVLPVEVISTDRYQWLRLAPGRLVASGASRAPLLGGPASF
jgi:S1-C subfamily serine protease